MIQTIADALSERGYDILTPVQEAVTEAALDQADLLVSAQTGSGKTVGFGLAIATTLLGEAQRFGPAAAPLALVIAPTRELALQVRAELSWLYAKTGATVISCIGGMDMRDERRALDRGAHIVVATPGRLVDHIKRGGIDMTDLRAVVLDEADEMLDLGFREDLEFILGSAPETRRTLMFSATVPPAIAKLAKSFQRDAIRVQTVSERTQHADIEYRALGVAAHDAENAIINVLRYYDAANAIVFCNTRAMVNRLTARFANRGFSFVALSGELSQTERTHALQAMRDGRARVCVATDVAARGIDLPNLELVIHAELPSNSEGLLHRSGRTGRAGRKGVSVLIVPGKLRSKAERLLKTARIDAEWAAPPSADEILRRDEERLLADPVWSEPASAVERAFADKLLGLHDAATIAAAYLRLYRAGRSAPEDLTAVDATSKPRERTPFGPGVWFSMSVGREARAEARWLLPLLCRAGNIDKDAIGAIRIQQNETFVELTEASVAGFLAAVGPAMTLEEGIRIARLDQAPDLARQPDRDSPKPRPDRAERATPAAAAASAGHEEQATAAASTAAAPTAANVVPHQRAAPAPEVASDAGEGDRSATPVRRKERHKPGDRPGEKPVYKPADRPQYAPRRDEGRPQRAGNGPSKSAGFKRHADAPTKAAAAKADGALTDYKARPQSRDDWKKPKGAAPADKPRANAADTSKRFVPPGKTAAPRAGDKPAGKFGGKPSGKFGRSEGRPGAAGAGAAKSFGSKSQAGKPRGPKGGSATPRRDKP
jgi:ATP-dependent RNA helicase DeaD